MTWFKVDDGFAFHPKAVTAGNEALGLWVRAGSWSGQQLTDGHIPVTMIAPLGGTRTDAERLVAAGLWHAPGDDCEVCKEQGTIPFASGYQFHDWVRMQPTRADTEATRLARAEAGRLGGRRSGETRRRKANEAVASRKSEAKPKQTRTKPEAGASRLLEAKTNPVPTRPDPSRSSDSPLY